MPRIFGQNVVLREFRWEDLPGIRSWMTDPETTDMLGDRFINPQTWEQTETYLRDRLDGNAGGKHFVIAEPQKLDYLGEVSIVGINTIARFGTLIIVLKPDSTSKGYGTEAVRLVLKYAFDYLNLERMNLSVDSNNLRGIRAYEKAGFHHEGRRRREAYRNGKYSDILTMGILREEFESHSTQ